MSRTLHLTTPLMHGTDVKHLQEELVSRGYFKAPLDGAYGPVTAQAVYRAKYWLGYPKPDHIAGDLFRLYLMGTKKATSRMRMYATLRRRKAKQVTQGQLLLNEARAHLGTKESPPESNRVLFSTWYGLIGSWCAMFVSYCGVKVGYKAFKRGIDYAYVPYVVGDARRGANNLTLVHSSDVKPGDLVCYDWNSDGIADHIGIFEGWISRGTSFNAIEGNTAQGNDSNGGQVMRRDRYVSNVQAFVRAH